MKKYKCPCCEEYTLFDSPPGTYEICGICGWEDDEVQYNNPDYEGGANCISLTEAKKKYKAKLMVDNLVETFRQFAREYDNFRKNGTSTQMNRKFDEMCKIVKQLEKLKEMQKLRQLLDAEEEAVRYHSSCFLLEYFQDEAVTVLESLSTGKGFYAFNAKMMLQEWRKGNIKFDYYKK